MKQRLFLFFILIGCNPKSKTSVPETAVANKTIASTNDNDPGNLMLDEDKFWQEIAKTHNGISLTNILNKINPEEIVAFSNRFDSLMSTAYDWRLWGGAFVIYGGCSDDCFDDFRANLIMQGKERFYQTLRDPESSITWINANELTVDENPSTIISEVYRTKTGKEIPYQKMSKFEPSGVKFDEATVDRKYPKLAKKFSSN